MRLAFLGTPEPAVASLRALVEAGHEIVLVITRPDKRRGRGSELSPSPVKAAALELGLHVEHKLAALGDVSVDLAVVVAYGRIIPVPFGTLPHGECSLFVATSLARRRPRGARGLGG